MKFPESNTLLLHLVVETMINSKITRKKWLNEAFTSQITTKKPWKNHVDPIDQSADEPVLKLLLHLAHGGLEIYDPQTMESYVAS